METNANRSCEVCGAQHFGSIENFNSWLSAHKESEHTTGEDMLAKFVGEELDFLSSHPKRDDIEKRIEELKAKAEDLGKRNPPPAPPAGNPHRLALT